MKYHRVIELSNQQRDRYAEALIIADYPWNGEGLQTPCAATIEDYLLFCHRAYYAAAPLAV